MAFIDKRLLLASEICLQWVEIGADVYMSVYNQSSSYYRIYKSTGGGPTTTIKTSATSTQNAFYIFAIGSILYEGHYTNSVNSFRVFRYFGGTSWAQDGYCNGVDSIICRREYNGGVYFLLTGNDASFADGKTILAQYGVGGVGNFTVLKDTSNSGAGGRVMRSFTFDPADDKLYIFDQDEGVGIGNATIYSKDGGTEETLITFGAGSDALDLNFVNSELYLLRTDSGANVNHIFSKLSDLTTLATEDIIDTSSIPNGTPGVGLFRNVRSCVLHDMLIVSYQKPLGSTSDYGFFTYDATEEDLTVLSSTTGAKTNKSQYGDFTVIGDNAIFGIAGKFIELYHQAPDDPEPPDPPDPDPIEQLTEEIIIEVRDAPCNPVTLCWLNSNGVWETYCFDDRNGIFETEIKTRIDAEYERYIEDLATGTNSYGITAKSVMRSLTVGADNIGADVYVGLIDLFTSPSVGMLIKEDPITWLPVRVSPGNIKYSEHDHSLEITLELPELFIQRS
jgi:hypothetical protein